MEQPPTDWPAFYVMRHGLTSANVDGLVAGRTQTDLTPEGIEQSKKAGAFVRGLPITQIYCSPMNRTRQTLEVMNLTLSAKIDARLIETDFGEYDGKSFDHWKASGLSVASLYANPEQKIAGGESFSDVANRGLAFMRENVKAGETLFCVTHGSFVKMLLAKLYPQRFEDEVRKRTIGNCEIFRLAPDGFESVYGESIWH